MQLIRKYFPDLDSTQSGKFERLLKIIPILNERINVVSRKDIDSLEERHILHSLAIARKFSFMDHTTIIDVGTGGGFPGIPLAILFPGARFTMVDSIGKKIRLVNEVIGALNLSNATALRERMENLNQVADFVVSRAVTAFPMLHVWTEKLIKTGNRNNMPNGLISLKGGDLTGELAPLEKRVKVFPISDWFEEPFFYTKKIVFLKK